MSSVNGAASPITRAGRLSMSGVALAVQAQPSAAYFGRSARRMPPSILT
jgi:hypothetical protein